MTFIREWTDPENSMHSGLGWLLPNASRATKPSDRGVEGVPPPEGGFVVMRAKQKKRSSTPGLTG
jgi:hypothetical protein